MHLSIDVGEKNFAYCILDQGKILSWEKVNLLKKKTQTVLVTCEYLTDLLVSLNLENCELVLIEQQMRSNIRAAKVAQHIWSWIRGRYPDLKVQFIPSFQKTQFFLSKNTLSDKQRKVWSVAKVQELLIETGQESWLEHLQRFDKQDDLSDCYLQHFVFSQRVQSK
jgi:uncharacterized phage-like protein YoqJ